MPALLYTDHPVGMTETCHKCKALTWDSGKPVCLLDHQILDGLIPGGPCERPLLYLDLIEIRNEREKD